MKRPPVPHPLDIALRDRFARQSGIDPAQLAAWLEWRETPPRAIVDRLVAAFFPLVPPEAFLSDEETLPSVDNGGTVVENMQIDSPRRRLGRPSTDHPFPRALRQRGVTLAEWAKEHGASPATVSSWFLGKNARRKIPMSVAQQIERELGVPLAAWKNGIKYDL